MTVFSIELQLVLNSIAALLHLIHLRQYKNFFDAASNPWQIQDKTNLSLSLSVSLMPHIVSVIVISDSLYARVCVCVCV